MTRKINQELLILNNLSKIKMDKISIEKERKEIGNSPLAELNIGKATMAKLIESGIKTVEQLKELTDEELNKIIPNPLSIKSVKNALENN